MRRKWLRNSLLALGLVALTGYLARDFIFFTFLYRGTRADWELSQLRFEHDQTLFDFDNVRRANEKGQAVDEARKQSDARQARIRRRSLEIVEANPGTRAELSGLFFVAGTWPDTDDGKNSLARLTERIATCDLSQLGLMLQSTPVRQRRELRDIAPALEARARRNAEHPNAAILLSKACWILQPESTVKNVPPEFASIADLIVNQHAASPHIAGFCMILGNGEWSPVWARPFEPHLRRILEINHDRFVRSSAMMALASLLQDSGAGRQEEAQQLYERFLTEFDGKTKYHAAGIEQSLRDVAKRQLEIIRSHGVGMPAPTTKGLDLEGRRMSLEDYRGKVVLVSFWASWCAPCLAMMPHEKELLERFPADRFAIVGVNSDTRLDRAEKVVSQKEIPWRSFRNATAGEPEIADRWHISGYPTFYLLDPQGVVRRRWIGDQPPEELQSAIELLLAGRLPEEQSNKALPELPVKSYAPITVHEDEPGARGFVAKVHRSDSGEVFRYVVYLPSRESKEPLPVILFLHGSGYSGKDGRRQLTGALANAIQERGGDFPFLAIFPQSHGESWQADSPDGRRAMAILDEVIATYSADASRIILTGLSMGGEGTWSLAAAHPDRWSAIVPICGGGDPATASRIAHLPCWCFHGEADRMIPPLLSQKMVEAIRKAGGEPLYQQYPGVGHNCWDQTYARNDLYEWMLAQKRTAR